MRIPSAISQHVNSLRALVAHRARDHGEAGGAGGEGLPERLVDVFVRTWDLGFTAFGGPPVHFQILHGRFVDKYEWVDEQTVRCAFPFSLCFCPGAARSVHGYLCSLENKKKKSHHGKKEGDELGQLKVG